MDFQAMLAAARAAAREERAKKTQPASQSKTDEEHFQQQGEQTHARESKEPPRQNEAEELSRYIAMPCSLSRASGAATSKNFLLVGVSEVRYFPEWLSLKQEQEVLSFCAASPAHKWTHLSRRKLQNWGGQVRLRPGSRLSSQEEVLGRLENKEQLPSYMQPLGSWLVQDGIFPKTKWPNHVLLNRYEPGQGIMAHKDGPLYHPVVAILSLGSDSVMHFYRDIAATKVEHGESFSVALQRGSLLVFSQQAYCEFYHCIPEVEVDVISSSCINRKEVGLQVGTKIRRSTRTSLTIRHVPE
eukprot:gb/GEZN01009918.1/.p1 GENE.gb/GEZN01009918.1/~~gb/GEZN01009918.1/.p1  ORF type:complete len:299 (+),score=47.86 gb/GEZN01009918.1/:53-949(+)